MRLYLFTGEGDDGDRLFVKHADAQRVIDGLQALLNERDAEIDRLKGTPERLIAAIEAEQDRLSEEDYLMDSEDCVNLIRENLSKPPAHVDFNAEVVLPAPSDPTWAVPVRLNFDGAEGEGRLWLSVDHEHDDDEPSIAVEGRENARTLARLLFAWAGDK